MKTKIEIIIDGPDGELISALRDDMRETIFRKTDQFLKQAEVKKTNTAFSIKTESVHE